MYPVPYIDLHCDTLTDWIDRGESKGIYRLPDKMADLTRLHETQVTAQLFAIFFPPLEENERNLNDDMIFEESVRIFKEALEAHGDIFAQATNVPEILKNKEAGKLSGILSIEDGRAVQGDFKKLKYFYDCGVRCMALVWNFGSMNYKNCFGAPNSEEFRDTGLTDFGKEAVGYMQELGMLVDVAHLSDGGFWDVVRNTTKPFVASHSNARGACDILRNLSDEMLRTLADRGGVTGLNFCPDLTVKGSMDCNVQDLARQVLYMVNTAGEDVVALGTDFDGIGGKVEVDEPTKMWMLIDELKKAGMTSGQLDKFISGNALRVFRDAMK